MRQWISLTKNKLFFLINWLLLVLPAVVLAEYEGPITAKITNVSSYSQYGAQAGGADVTLTVDINSPNCPGGIWLGGTDAGFKQNFATAIIAVSLGKTITYYVENDHLWPGSSLPVCHLYQISIAGP